MANRYYSIRLDSVANTHEDIKAALLDYYGAYHDPDNPTGVDFLYDTSPTLIFTCTAIADRPLRAHADTRPQVQWAYGTGYTSGPTLDGQVNFSGTYTLSTEATEYHLVLGLHTLLWQTDGAARLNSMLVLVGQLTNDDYAVFGARGTSHTTYHANCAAHNTTDDQQLFTGPTFSQNLQSAGGKLFKQRLILTHGALGLELNADDSIASFQDLGNVAYTGTSNSTYIVAPAHIITSKELYIAAGATQVLRDSGLLMEYEAVP